MRRRWQVRPRGEEPEAVREYVEPDRKSLVIEVAPDSGSVTVGIGRESVIFTPEDISRARRALLEAQAVALLDRDRW